MASAISPLYRKHCREELQGLLAWIACIGDAHTIEGYSTFLRGAGFTVDNIKERNDALEEMANNIRLKLLGAEIMTGLGNLGVARY